MGLRVRRLSFRNRWKRDLIRAPSCLERLNAESWKKRALIRRRRSTLNHDALGTLLRIGFTLDTMASRNRSMSSSVEQLSALRVALARYRVNCGGRTLSSVYAT
jgi:hypothetical protein